MNLFHDFHLEFYHKSFDSDYLVGEKIQSKYYMGAGGLIDMFDIFQDFLITQKQDGEFTAYSFIVDEIQMKIGTYESI